MTRLTWGEPGTHEFETGVDRGVLYVDGFPAVTWPGLISVIETPVGAEPRPYYIDGVKYQNRSTTEEFAGTISAFYSPEVFDYCDGTLSPTPGVAAHQQKRLPFAFCFRTLSGNDLIGPEESHKIHLVYNAKAAPTTKAYRSISDEPEPVELSWGITTRSMPYPGLLPTAHIWFDMGKLNQRHVQWLEDTLYGTEETNPRIPLPDEVAEFMSFDPDLFVTNLGSGVYNVTGPDDKLRSFEESIFELNTDAILDLTEDGRFRLVHF